LSCECSNRPFRHPVPVFERHFECRFKRHFERPILKTRVRIRTPFENFSRQLLPAQPLGIFERRATGAPILGALLAIAGPPPFFKIAGRGPCF
jgi:hypothetical protein